MGEPGGTAIEICKQDQQVVAIAGGLWQESLKYAPFQLYVGEAKGSGGLYDRIMRKHVSGDDRHALQRYFTVDFPDRVIRRDHIMGNVQVKWVIVENILSVAVVERLAIWLLEPPLNRK